MHAAFFFFVTGPDSYLLRAQPISFGVTGGIPISLIRSFMARAVSETASILRTE